MALRKFNAKPIDNGDACFLKLLANPRMIEKYENLELYTLAFEMTLKCRGSCNFCFSFSTPDNETHIPRRRALALLDEAKELGIKAICWCGGDPLEHPNFFELLDYAYDLGMEHTILSSGVIDRTRAKELSKRCKSDPERMTVGIHIDTIDQQVYNRIHYDPETLEVRMQGYRNLLEAGFPSANTFACITVVNHIIPSFKKTVDWYMDEMGASAVLLSAFRPIGHGEDRNDWECSKSEIARMVEYKAKKMGDHWNYVNPTDGGSLFCTTLVYVSAKGIVLPCSSLITVPKFHCGNIYEESLVDIFKRNRDLITFNFEIQGYCGHCPSNPYCVGCRGNAYWSTDDLAGPDMKCHRNIESNVEYIYKG